MKILIRSHTSLHASEPPGGASRLMKNLALALAGSGWDVTIICPSPSDGTTVDQSQVSYQEFPYGNPTSSTGIILNTVRGASTYYRIVQNGEFDIVLDDISHYPFFPAHFLCPDQTTNAVFMHTAFFGAAREYIGPFRGTVIDLIDRSLPYLNQPEIICAGEGTENRINEELNYHRTHILNPCIKADDFNFNFDPSSNQVLYLGRLGPRKNVSCLLRAWQLVEEVVDQNVKLVIAGSGTEANALHMLRDELDLNQVDFRGYVTESEKRELYENSLLYILPSKMEGYVTTGLEALAAGTPVVGSNTTGIRDYIHHEETGYLFPVDDQKALAELLIDLILDPSQMESVVEAGQDLAREHDYESFKTKAHSVFTTLGKNQ